MVRAAVALVACLLLAGCLGVSFDSGAVASTTAGPTTGETTAAPTTAGTVTDTRTTVATTSTSTTLRSTPPEPPAAPNASTAREFALATEAARIHRRLVARSAVTDFGGTITAEPDWAVVGLRAGGDYYVHVQQAYWYSTADGRVDEVTRALYVVGDGTADRIGLDVEPAAVEDHADDHVRTTRQPILLINADDRRRRANVTVLPRNATGTSAVTAAANLSAGSAATLRPSLATGPYTVTVRVDDARLTADRLSVGDDPGDPVVAYVTRSGELRIARPSIPR